MSLPFERPNLGQRVVEHMTQMITEGQWLAGTLLPPEPVLAQEYGVSRTVIRECVRVLSSRGMVEVQQGRGTRVISPTDWNVTEPLALLVRADRSALNEWLEVRIMLEVESARLAAQRATFEDRDALRAVLAVIEKANSDPATYCEADIQLHLTIARAAHNSALVRLLQPVMQPLREGLQEAAWLPQAREAATLEHRELIESVLEADPSGAYLAMRRHLQRVASEIPQVVAEQAAVPQ